MRTFLLTACLGLALLVASAPTPTVEANHPADPWPACGGGVTTHCYSEFLFNDGDATAAGFSLGVSGDEVSAFGTVFLGVDEELSPAADPDDKFAITLQVGAAPVVAGVMGTVDSITFGSSSITFVVRPRAASWRGDGSCTLTSCPSPALVDFTSLLFFGFLSGVPSGLSAEDTAEISAVLANGQGMWFSTNAETFRLPGYDADSNAITFSVAAPSLKSDGSTANTGSFHTFVPNSFVINEWGISNPSSLCGGGGSVSVSRSDGGTVSSQTVTCTGSGVEINADYSYSTPKFFISASLVGGPCGLDLPVWVTWHGNPVLVGLDLMYGSQTNPQATGHPFQVTDADGQALFRCLPSGKDYLLQVKWGEQDGVHVGQTETFELTSENTIKVPSDASTLELRTRPGGHGQLRTDIAWLKGSEVGLLPHGP